MMAPKENPENMCEKTFQILRANALGLRAPFNGGAAPTP